MAGGRRFDEARRLPGSDGTSEDSNQEPEAPPTPPAPGSQDFLAYATRTAAWSGAPLGRIEVPRLRLSAVIGEGVEETTLKHAVGHVPRTAFPGERGNVGLAAHRDTFFRKLKKIAVGDTIRLTTSDGVFQYVVHSTVITTPADDTHLMATPEPTVTLVTCYPFAYIGKAPRRFLVQAGLVEPGPSVPVETVAISESVTPPAGGR
jgi:LPXTG-site transpeptidase (sortase) family protein